MSNFAAGVVFLALAASGSWAKGAPKAAPGGAISSEAPPPLEGPRKTSSWLQSQVMDFSDQYVSAMWAVMDEYIRTEPDPSKRVLAQSWKVLFGSSSMTIAASTDPRTNLLDMAVFISVGRWAVNQYWIPKVFGDRAKPLGSLYEDQNRKVWKLLAEVLTADQQANLKALLRAWEEENPAIHEVVDMRLRNLEGVRPGEFDAKTSAKGLLASVQQLLGRVDTSLLYGERVMFYMERTPRILTQQTDLTLAQIAEAFPIAAVHLDGLPSFSSDWSARLQKGIDHNQALAKDLLPEVRTTLGSADQLATTLNLTLRSVQELVDKTPPFPAPTADAISQNLKQMNSALDHLDSTVAGVNQLLEKNVDGGSKAVELIGLVDARSEHAVDFAFHRALILLGTFFGGVILVLIAARMIFYRTVVAPAAGVKESGLEPK